MKVEASFSYILELTVLSTASLTVTNCMVHIHSSGFFKEFPKNKWILSYFLLEKHFGVQKIKIKN